MPHDDRVLVEFASPAKGGRDVCGQSVTISEPIWHCARNGTKCSMLGVGRSFTFAASSHRRKHNAASACGSARNAATSDADIAPPCKVRLSTLSGDSRVE